MPTSYNTFQRLPFAQQVPRVWVEGQFIAKRWEEENAIGLYYMAGDFFCEVYFEQECYTVERLFAFTDSEYLEDYTPYIQLDDLLT